MKKPLIVVKVPATKFQLLAVLMQHVIQNLTGNGSFLLPIPTLISVQAALDDLTAAIAVWGTVHSRGSHPQYLDLVQKATFAHNLLTQLGSYCMSVVPTSADYATQTAILSSSGFTIKNASTPTGILGMVQNFRRVITLELNLGELQMEWDKPLNVTTATSVKLYKIYRNTVNNYATATLIDSINVTKYITAPGSGTWYFWIVPRSKAGDGVVSNVVVVVIT